MSADMLALSEMSAQARVGRKALAAAIAKREISGADALDDPRADRMTLYAFLRAQPKWGKHTAARGVAILRTRYRLGVTEHSLVGELTDRQREAVVNLLAGPRPVP